MELSLQAYSLRTFFIVFGVFIVGFIGCVLIGAFAAPAVVLGGSYDAGMDSGPQWTFSLDRPLTKYNQAILMRSIFVVSPQDQSRDAMDVNLQIAVFSSSSCIPSDPWTPLSVKTESVSLKCPFFLRSSCDPVFLLYEPFITPGCYRFNVTLLTLPSLPSSLPSSPVQGVIFQWQYANDAFTRFELWSRVTFAFATVAFSVVFARRMWSFPRHCWAREQRWTIALLATLFWFNNPILFPLSVTLDTWVFDVADQILASSFLSLLLLFWLVMFHTIMLPPDDHHHNNHQLLRFYGPKVVLVTLFWIASSSLYLSVELLDARIQLTQSPLFWVFLVATLTTAAVYIAWLGYLIFSVIRSMRAHLSQIRPRVFFSFTIAVIVVTIVGILFGLLGPLRSSGAEFLAFFGLFNGYVYVLTLMYLPASSAASSLTLKSVGLDVIRISSDDDDAEAHEMDFSSGGSTDFEISLSDVDMLPPTQLMSPTHDE